MKLKHISSILLVSVASFSLAHASYTPPDAHRIADAIYLVEGGSKAKVPYGILSVKVRSVNHARQVCLNTIQNNYERWLKTDRSDNFIDYLADRYCPPSDAEGNRNWKRNIKFFLGQDRGPNTKLDSTRLTKAKKTAKSRR